jgi:L-ribulose-5-phosphate 3-epimerase
MVAYDIEMTSGRELFALAGAASASPSPPNSYWHFKTAKYPVEKVIEEAADIGFDGVEILHRQMTGESPAYVNKLKRMAFARGLALPMLSIHQDSVLPGKEERARKVLT